MLKLARGGDAESDATEVAVKPAGDPSEVRRVTTHMPAPWRRNAWRKAWEGESASTVFTYLS
ncbi:MAG: putative nucleic acid-binding Zn ribbon protein [Pontimonas sp.]|jgi:predicted nucleic acid-binding Zn ribbon protein